MPGRNEEQKRKFRRVHSSDLAFNAPDKDQPKADQYRIKLAIQQLAATNADDEKIINEAERLGIKPASALVSAVKRIREAMSDRE